MAQQINLFTPLLLSRKPSFTARTMAVSLLLFLGLVALLAAYGVWALRNSSEAIKKELADRAAEKASLTQAIQGKSSADGSNRDVLARELGEVRAQLAERQRILSELGQGLVSPETGHAARLRLVAQTIPNQAWINELSSDGQLLSLTGVTTSPPVLNDWMDRLAAHPLLKGQKFAVVKIERQGADTGRAVSNGAAGNWSFNLASSPATPNADKAGGHP